MSIDKMHWVLQDLDLSMLLGQYMDTMDLTGPSSKSTRVYLHTIRPYQYFMDGLVGADIHIWEDTTKKEFSK